MIAVIVPVYNSRDFLPKCLDSILSQTIKDISVILIDDGSTDGSSQICDLYSIKDSRINVYHNDNHGITFTRNFGLQQALRVEADYISFVDSDDWIENDMLSKMLCAAQETGADVVECGYWREFPDEIQRVEFESKDIKI